MAADSFTHNKLTMIKGPAGSGKSYLALGFLFNQLEKHYIDKPRKKKRIYTDEFEERKIKGINC